MSPYSLQMVEIIWATTLEPGEYNLQRTEAAVTDFIHNNNRSFKSDILRLLSADKDRV